MLAATLGAWAVTAGAAALGAVALVAATDLSRSDAIVISSMTSYLLFAFLMMWSFAERRLLRVWVVLTLAAIGAHAGAAAIETGLPVTVAP